MRIGSKHCVEGIGICSFSGPYFPALELNTESISPNSVQMRENTDQKNFECRHFSRSES